MLFKVSTGMKEQRNEWHTTFSQLGSAGTTTKAWPLFFSPRQEAQWWVKAAAYEWAFKWAWLHLSSHVTTSAVAEDFPRPWWTQTPDWASITRKNSFLARGIPITCLSGCLSQVQLDFFQCLQLQLVNDFPVVTWLQKWSFLSELHLGFCRLQQLGKNGLPL